MPNLDALFRPRSIALVGASPDRHTIRGRVVEAVRNNGFDGPLYPVSRSHASIDGLTTYSSPTELPQGVDLAIVTIPAVYVAQALQQCAERGVRAAVIISSGFAEERGSEGAAREEAIRRIVECYDLAVLGPNSEGFLNTALPLAATFSPTVSNLQGGLTPTHTGGCGIAVVSHSGGIGFSFFDRGRPKSLRFSLVVSMGNEGGLEALDVIDYLIDDAHSSVVLGFIEGLRSPHAFARVAERAAARRKPLVLAKVGVSEAGAQAAASHTATLAGSQQAYAAVFARYGVIPGHDTDSMLDVAAGFAFFGDRLPAGKRVAVLTPSGGAGIWLADVCHEHGLEVPPLDDATRAEIDRLLPAYGTSRNPVDVTAQVIFRLGYAPVLELIAASPSIDAVIVAGSQGIQKYVEPQLDTLAQLAKRIDKPVIFCTYAQAHPEIVAMLAGAGFPCTMSMPNAARTLAAMADYGRFLQRFDRDQQEVDDTSIRIDEAVCTRLADARRTLCEYEAGAVLADLGIADFVGELVSSPDQAAAAADAFQRPVALKIQSPAVSHKARVGGVVLDVSGTEAARAAYADVVERVRSRVPDADVHGVLVTPMCAPGVEFIVGAKRDDDLGPMLLLGAGGNLVEVLDEIIVTPAPVSRNQLLDLLATWKGRRLLDGSAGLPAGDIDALVDLAVNVSRFAAAADNVRSLDLNPVIVHPRGQGVSVADALIETGFGVELNASRGAKSTTEAMAHE